MIKIIGLMIELQKTPNFVRKQSKSMIIYRIKVVKPKDSIKLKMTRLNYLRKLDFLGLQKSTDLKLLLLQKTLNVEANTT